jgi:hypothetical protein
LNFKSLKKPEPKGFNASPTRAQKKSGATHLYEKIDFFLSLKRDGVSVAGDPKVSPIKLMKEVRFQFVTSVPQETCELKPIKICKNEIIRWCSDKNQGCQIFQCTTYQNGRNTYTKLPQIYQMAVKYLDQMSIKYTNILHSKVLQNLPKFAFLVRKYTISQP